MLGSGSSEASRILARNGLAVVDRGGRRVVVHTASNAPVGGPEELDNYEEVSNAVQLFAHGVMMEEVGVDWWSLDGASTTRSTTTRRQQLPAGTNRGASDTAERAAARSGPSGSSFEDRFLATPDWHSNEHILLLITGMGSVRAGVWGRQLCICDCLEHGTALPLMKWAAKEKGWAVVAMDPNDPAQAEEEGGLEHCARVWQHALLKGTNPKAKVYAVAHSFGGPCFIDCLGSTADEALQSRLAAVAFTDSVHFVEGECFQSKALCEGLGKRCLSAAQLKWLAERGRHWRQGREPLDTVEYEHNDSCGCKCVSAGIEDHPSVNYAADQSIRLFFESFGY